MAAGFGKKFNIICFIVNNKIIPIFKYLINLISSSQYDWLILCTHLSGPKKPVQMPSYKYSDPNLCRFKVP